MYSWQDRGNASSWFSISREFRSSVLTGCDATVAKLALILWLHFTHLALLLEPPSDPRAGHVHLGQHALSFCNIDFSRTNIIAIMAERLRESFYFPTWLKIHIPIAVGLGSSTQSTSGVRHFSLKMREVLRWDFCILPCTSIECDEIASVNRHFTAQRRSRATGLASKVCMKLSLPSK